MSIKRVFSNGSKPNDVMLSNIYSTNTNSQSTNSIAISDDGNRIAIVDGSYLHLSTNGGISFSKITPPVPFSRIAMSAAGQYMLATGYWSFLYVSNDFGQTWTKEYSERYWTSLAVSATGQYMYAGAVNTTTDDGNYLFKSNNFGTSFGAYTTFTQEWSSVATNDGGNIVVAGDYSTTNGTVYGALFVSTNYMSGLTRKLNQIHDWTDISCVGSGQYIAAIGPNGVYLSSDTGASWHVSSLPVTGTFTALTASNNNEKIVVAPRVNYGLNYSYITLNRGTSWEPITVLGKKLWSDLAITRNGSILIALDYDGNLFKLTL